MFGLKTTRWFGTSTDPGVLIPSPSVVTTVEIDADTLRDLSGYESADLEVVAEGGTMPTPAMLAWARELKLGAWFQLDYRGRQDAVQLAWRGLQKQLALFVTPQGRGVLQLTERLAGSAAPGCARTCRPAAASAAATT